jgi:hypothetical protein
MLESAQAQEKISAERSEELVSRNNETVERAAHSQSESPNPAPASPALVAELETLRARLEDLNRQLIAAERTNRQLDAILGRNGIQISMGRA